MSSPDGGFLKEHPALVLSVVVAAGVLIAGGLHLYVTGEPLGISLSNPIDSIALSLIVLVLSIVNLAAWAFLPAAFTAVAIRVRRAEVGRLCASNVRAASTAALVVGALSLASLTINVSVEPSVVTALAVASLLASLAVVTYPALETQHPCRLRRAIVMAALWVLGLLLPVLVSTFFFLRLSETTGWLADPQTSLLARSLLLAAMSGFAAFSASLVPRRGDRRQVAAVSIGLVGILCIVGAVRPTYSEALRATGFGQERVKGMWFAASACGPVAAMKSLRVTRREDGSCEIEDVYVVVRGAVDIVLSSSPEAARDGERVRVPRAALLGEFHALDKAASRQPKSSER